MKNGDLPAMPQERGIWVDGIGHCPTIATGLTKREMFAMAAMQGLLAKPETLTSYAAQDAVGFADDLLAELERKK